MKCLKYADSRAKLVLAIQKLDISTNPISLSDLLDGAGFSPHKSLRVMWIFLNNFVKSTDSFPLL